MAIKLKVGVISFVLLIFPVICYKAELYQLLHIAVLSGVYIILALGANIVLGYLGLLDLGFIAFYAISAYTSALLSIRGWPFWAILPATLFITVSFRFLVGIPALRLQGDYLAIVTLGFCEIIRLVANNCDKLTNGPKGLPGVSQSIQTIFTSEVGFYYLTLCFVILSIAINYRLEHSQVGRSWVALREDELAAETVGIDVTRTKLIAFTFSSIFAAIAGWIYTHLIKFISPELFTFWESVFLVCMVVLGGMGSIFGVIIGVILLISIPELSRSILGTQFVNYRMLLFGFVLIFMMIFRPQGLIPSKRRALELTQVE